MLSQPSNFTRSVPSSGTFIGHDNMIKKTFIHFQEDTQMQQNFNNTLHLSIVKLSMLLTTLVLIQYLTSDFKIKAFN